VLSNINHSNQMNGQTWRVESCLFLIFYLLSLLPSLAKALYSWFYFSNI